ncbi:signal recognition particle-docking protein FtsY [Candidatus Mycoplasma pogonae]
MSFFKKIKERIFSKKITTEEELKKQSEKELQKKLEKEGKVNSYVAGMKKSSSFFTQKIIELQNSHNEIDEEFFEELEEILIMADISVELVDIILDQVKKEVKIENISDPKLIGEILTDKIFVIYANNDVIDTRLNIQDGRLNVMTMIGVNGSGKTTSIAKIAYKLKQENKKVLIAAADTFRAAAAEQLEVWANKIGVDIVLPNQNETDPSSVVYRSLERALDNNYDVLIIDTAGRLQNKVNLMNELKKMHSIIEKKVPGAPHEVLLTIDATTGQNAVSQAQHFKDVTNLTGIILTKMDGTSKGGIVLTIKNKIDVNVKLIGLGEKLEDLHEFDLDMFIYGLAKELIEQK